MARAEQMAPTPGTGPWRKLYEEIGQLLFENSLEPTPENFDICHRYLTADDGELNSRVDRALKEGGLTAVSVAAIIAQRSVELSADDLSTMAESAQSQLEQIMSIVAKSTEDVRDYGNALGESTTALSSLDTATATVADLVKLTQEMIEKTRDVEEKLRRSGSEITLLRDNLTEARRKADSDPLTGLPNRRSLDQRLSTAVDKARADHLPLSIAICDIDKFKMVNDTHGHLVGDEVIKFVASALSRDGGDRLFVARYGGEEFVMLFDNMSPIAAANELNAIREKVSKLELKITATGDKLGKLSFSAGVAELEGRKDASSMLKAADTALYRAKNDGRNRVYIADPHE
jgi:diguanylate cyclase